MYKDFFSALYADNGIPADYAKSSRAVWRQEGDAEARTDFVNAAVAAAMVNLPRNSAKINREPSNAR